MTDQKHCPMPALTEQEREDIIAECEAAIKNPRNYQTWFVAMAKLTVASLTAPPVPALKPFGYLFRAIKVDSDEIYHDWKFTTHHGVSGVNGNTKIESMAVYVDQIAEVKYAE